MEGLRRLARAFWFFARGLVTSVIGNLSLAVLSVALALSLWLFVTDAENPTERVTFNSAIELSFVNVPGDLALSNASASTVRIDIEAPESDLAELRAADFVAEVNLGGLPPGNSRVPVSVRSTNADVRIVRTSPEQVDVTLEAVLTREVPIRVVIVGSPQQGFAAADDDVEPDTATVSGPRSLVELVDAAVAEVGITGLRVDFANDRVPLRARDARGGEIGRISVQPETARVRVDIEQQLFSLEFAVNPLVTGRPAVGYNIAGIAVEPSIVTVSGPLDELQSLDPVAGITTQGIQMDDARSTFTRSVELVLPSGLTVGGSTSVTVTIAIEPARGEASFLVVPQVRNVADGLAVTPASSVLVTIAGDVPTLQSTTPESITVVVDAQGLGEGLHSVALQITPPAGTTIVRVEPGELGIALTSR
jgi:YbbR domain-containing protein